MSYKRNRSFKPVCKKIIQRNGKKIQFLCIQDYVMRTKHLNLHAIFFSGKCLFEYKIQFATEKKTKKIFGAISSLLGKIFCVAIKKMLVMQLPFMENVMITVFFPKGNIVFSSQTQTLQTPMQIYHVKFEYQFHSPIH